MYFVIFIVSAVMIILAGIRLTRYADILSEKLNLGKVWIGVLLLGFVTSLPEAVTTLVAVISVGANDLAVGNIVGSNVFNPMLIVMMDAMYRKQAVTNAIEANRSHFLAAGCAILLTLILLVELWFHPVATFGNLTWGSWLIIVLYFAGMRVLATSGSSSVVIAEADEHPLADQHPSLGIIILNLLGSALLVIFGAVLLANSADTLATQTGLGRTFVGSIFLAWITSLPELVVTISALRMGAFDLAVGNIFGSNMTNIFLLPVCNIFYEESSILAGVSSNHMFTALLSIFLTVIVLAGLKHRTKPVIGGLGWDSWVMTVAFIGGTWLLYLWR